MKTAKHFTLRLSCLILIALCVIALFGCNGDRDHSWSEWEQTKAPTCSAAGTQERTCSGCGETEVEDIPAKGHAWADATCLEAKHCTACGATEGETLAHVWLEANCTEAKRCSVCKTTEGEALGHTLEERPAKEATCDKDGYSAHQSCTVCDYATEHETVAALGHSGGEATCTIGALCDTCGKEYGEAASHSYEDTVVAPTCDEKGYTAHTCSVCGDEHTDSEVASLGHSGGKANCTDKATCTVCFKEYGDEPSHDWGEGAVTTAAGCESFGVRTYTCSACGETKVENLPASGHDYEDVVTAPGCLSSGYTTHTCNNCGDSYTDTPTSALGHEYGDQAATCISGRSCQRDNCGYTEAALEHDYELVNTVMATCTTAKKLVYSCNGANCKAGYEVTEGDPLGHNYDNVAPSYELVNEENCEYVSVYKCNRCPVEKRSETFERHSYTASILTEASCVSVGTKKYQCGNCTYSYTEDIPANGSHNWNDGVLEGNKRTYTCTADGCNETKTVIDASAEQNTNLNSDDLAGSGEVALKDASINLGAIADDIAGKDINLSAGTLEGDELEAAKKTLSDEQLAQIGENPIYNFTITDINNPDDKNIGKFGDKLVTVTIPYVLGADEDVDSIYIWFINDDGEVEAIKADYANGYVSFETNHFSYYTVTRLTPAQRCEKFGHQERILETVAVTCISDGYTLVRCVRCAETFKKDIVEAGGHDLTVVDTPATCTEAGVHKVSCSKCDYKVEDITPASGHDYNLEETPATCAAAGLKVYTCDCGHSYEEKTPQLDHEYEESITPPTCDTVGYTLHSCKNCVHSYKDNQVAALGHDIECAFTWADNHKKATATVSCKNGCDLSESKEVKADVKTFDGGCGNTTVEYTVKYTYNGETFSDKYTEEGESKQHNLKDKYTHNEHEHWIGCRGCGIKHELAAHEWDEGVIISAPTCTKHGRIKYTCYCGRSVTEKVEATGHAWADATCIAPKTCTNCGETEGEAVGHDWKEATTEAPKTCNTCGAVDGDVHKHSWVDATCTMAKYCSTCNKIDGDPLGHKWVDATCTDVKYCEVCKATEGEALGHKWADATCTAAKTCKTCGVTEGAALGHKYSDATCTAPKTCEVCKATEGAALGHKYESTVTVPTCTEKGYTTYTCSRCEHSYTADEAEALGHKYADATCTAPKTCTVCGATEGEALGHKYADETCTEPKTCTVCKATEGEALGHKYEAAVTAPTCTKNGYTTYTCSVCNDTYNDNEVKATGHDFAAATCTAAKTCKTCGETEGVALGHKWVDATCTKAKYCSVCNEVEGEAKGHDYVAATCIAPETCKSCGATVGEALGHDWKPATTMAPKTCNVCGATEGDVHRHTWVDATCTAAKYCSTCNEVEGTALGHKWVDATCTEARYCAVCKLVDGKALGHNYIAEVTAPTCTADGYTTHTCSVCKDSYKDNEVKATGHDFAAATCTAAKTCKTCGETEGTALGHKYEAAVTAPTCTADGYTTYTCSVCKDSHKDNEVKALGHDFAAATCTAAKTCKTCGETEGTALGHGYEAVVTAPTCTDKGYTTYTCSRCGDSYTADEVDAKGHSYTEKITPATCIEIGYVTMVCSVCNDSYLDSETPALGHDLVNETIEPTCTEAGRINTSCTRCDFEGFEVLEAKGHSYSDANCTSPNTCTACGATDGEALGHDYEAVVTAPTCTKDGYTTYTCSVCGDSYIDDETAATGEHIYENGACINCGREESKCDHTDLYDAVIDLGEYGVCEGEFGYQTCDCGEVKVIDPNFAGAGFKCDIETTKQEQTKDENGNVCLIMQGVCRNCGLVIDGMMTMISAPCTQTINVSYTLTKDDVIILENGTASMTQVYHREGETVKIDLSELGACGGVLVATYCECGEVADVGELDSDCDFEQNATIEEFVDENGAYHQRMTGVCSKCGLTVVMDYYVVTNGCVTDKYEAAKISIGDEVLFDAIMDHSSSEDHEYVVTYEMKGDSCEDGVRATYVCKKCDHTYTSNYSHHQIMEKERIDLSEYGVCGDNPYLSLGECACGAESGFEYHTSCNMVGMGAPGYSDDEGNVHYTNTSFCQSCGLRYVREHYDVREGCNSVNHNNVDIYVGETAVLEDYEYVSYSVNHTYIYEYNFDGDTCADGYSFVATCVYCGDSHSGSSVGHGSNLVAYHELSDFGACGGFIKVYSCACGELGFVNRSDGCSMVYESSSYTDELGIQHNLETRTCKTCGLVVTRDYYSEKVGCERITTTVYSYYMDGKLLFDSVTSKTVSIEHSYEYEYVLNGETCEDGVFMTAICSVCGDTVSDEYYDHRTHETRYELLDYGACDGWITTYSCACGKNQGVHNFTTCSLSWRSEYYTDENGIEHELQNRKCEICGLVYTLDRYEAKEGCYINSHCTVSVTCGDVTVLENYKYVSIKDDHNYTYEFIMDGKSCEDGYTVISICQDCGYSFENDSRGHSTYVIERYDLSAMGMCGRHNNISYYRCPCGENEGVSTNFHNGCIFDTDTEYYTDDNGVRHEVYYMYCQLCDTCIIRDGYWVRGVCYDERYVQYTVEIGGKVVAELPECSDGGNEHHDYKYEFTLNDGASCDGGYTVSAVCSDCGYSFEDEGRGHGTYAIEKYDLSAMGMCGDNSYISYYRCPCGQQQSVSTNFGKDCSFRSEWDYYTDDSGVQHEIYYMYCELCDTRIIRDGYWINGKCYDEWYVQYTVEIGGKVVAELPESYEGRREHHDYKYEFTLNDGVSCEGGYTYVATCADCGHISEGSGSSHNTYLIKRCDFSEYNACGGYAELYSCHCGHNAYVNYHFECSGYWTNNEYIDEEGRTVFVDAYVCDKCDLRYQRSRYSERDAANCSMVNYYTIMVSVGDHMAASIDYTNIEESHNCDVSAELSAGSSSCNDGVTLTYTCRDCGYSYENYHHGHYTYDQQIIELDRFGSVCHGYAVLRGCACGYNMTVNLSHALCDLDQTYVSGWIDEAIVNGWYSSTNGNDSDYFHNNAYIYTCSVTDPDKCGLKIRYADYWLPEENCVAYQYQTWQFGYNEETGECEYELTFKYGSEKQYHSYVESKIEEITEDGIKIDGIRGDCTECKGYYYRQNYCRDNEYIKHEFVAENLAENSYNKLYEKIEVPVHFSCCVEAMHSSGSTYYRYVYVDGTEATEKHEVRFENCDVPGFDHGYKRISDHVYTDGGYEHSESVYAHYKADGSDVSYWLIISEYQENSYGYWERYDYVYDDDSVCRRTVTYTNSNGDSNVTEEVDHYSWSHVTITPETCTQDGVRGYECHVCGEIYDTYTVEPLQHSWIQVDDNFYFCYVCGLEGSNGASGEIVFEDLTDQYGEDENYVIGYYNRDNVDFIYYVSLILRNVSEEEENEVILDFYDFVELTDPRAISFSKSAIAQLATDLGYTEEEYDVRFTFVPVGADGSFDYAITLTDDERKEADLDNVVTDDDALVRFVGQGEWVTFTVTPEVDSIWSFTSISSYDSWAELLDANGGWLASNDDGAQNLQFLITHELKAGESYQLRVKWLGGDVESYMRIIFTCVPKN